MTSKNLLEREVSRCNRNLFIFNFGLTILASWVISWFFFNFDIFGKIILVMALMALPGYNYYNIYRRLENYQNHPNCKSILRLGNPIEVSKHIEEDLLKKILFPKNSNYFYENNKLTITPNWMIFRGFFHFYIIHVTELCWVYIKQTKHSVNFIPTGTTYSLIFNSRYMKNIEVGIESNEDKNCSLIELVYSIAPWAIYGFSEEIKELWETNPGALIQEVNSRIVSFHKLLKKHGKQKKK